MPVSVVVFTDSGFQQIQVPGFTVGGTFHIAAVFDPANLLLSIYRNGKLVSSVATNSTQLMRIEEDNTLWIGRNTVTSTGFDGMIDEVRLYTRALSPTEIAALVEPVIPGDVNGDGVVNLLDVAPFVEAISSGMFNPAEDINGDGFVDLLDIQPFHELLSG